MAERTACLNQPLSPPSTVCRLGHRIRARHGQRFRRLPAPVMEPCKIGFVRENIINCTTIQIPYRAGARMAGDRNGNFPPRGRQGAQFPRPTPPSATPPRHAAPPIAHSPSPRAMAVHQPASHTAQMKPAFAARPNVAATSPPPPPPSRYQAVVHPPSPGAQRKPIPDCVRMPGAVAHSTSPSAPLPAMQMKQPQPTMLAPKGVAPPAAGPVSNLVIAKPIAPANQRPTSLHFAAPGQGQGAPSALQRHLAHPPGHSDHKQAPGPCGCHTVIQRQLIFDKKDGALWMPDSTRCQLCFVTIGRGERHHCRVCGKFICDDCGRNKFLVNAPLKNKWYNSTITSARVCVDCVMEKKIKDAKNDKAFRELYDNAKKEAGGRDIVVNWTRDVPHASYSPSKGIININPSINDDHFSSFIFELTNAAQAIHFISIDAAKTAEEFARNREETEYKGTVMHKVIVDSLNTRQVGYSVTRFWDEDRTLDTYLDEQKQTGHTQRYIDQWNSKHP